jgi:hypothetical protein
MLDTRGTEIQHQSHWAACWLHLVSREGLLSKQWDITSLITVGLAYVCGKIRFIVTSNETLMTVTVKNPALY